MSEIVKLIPRIVLGIVCLIVSRAAFEVFHLCGWYPELQLADIVMVSPQTSIWGVSALAAIGIWAALDYLFYRRKPSVKDATESKRPRRGVAEIETAADACEKYEQRYWDFITGHQQEIEAAMSHRYCNGASIMSEFEKAQKAEEIIMTKMRERLGSEAGALVGMLSSLNIQADSDFRSLHWSNGTARYYGAVGKLLRRGLLEEAQKLDRHRLIF